MANKIFKYDKFMDDLETLLISARNLCRENPDDKHKKFLKEFKELYEFLDKPLVWFRMYQGETYQYQDGKWRLKK